MKMIWPQVDFCSGDICITLPFQVRKIEIQKFCPCRILCPWNVDKSLRFCSWFGFLHLKNFELNFKLFLGPRFSPKQQYSIHISRKQPISYLSDYNLAIMIAQNCFKISLNQIFNNFKLPLWFFQNQLKSDF